MKKKVNNFTHLHIHTMYSLLDGAIKVDELVKYLKENNMNACAITDHGWMAGVVDFYKSCKEANIKPIIGVEAYITEDEDNKEEDHTRDNMHMVLLAKNNIGYSKLLQLVSEAALDNFYYKPRINKNKLKILSNDVIATTGCLAGVLAKKLHFEKDIYGRAVKIIDPDNIIDNELQFYLDIFGKDFYLEIQVWDSPDNFQEVYNEYLLKIGTEKKLPFVLTADAHYLKQEDDKLHELLMAMQMGQTLERYRETAFMQFGPHFYVGNPREMLKRAKSINCEQSYYNTIEIANKCNVEIQLGKYREPIFDIKQTKDYKDFLIYKNK